MFEYMMSGGSDDVGTTTRLPPLDFDPYYRDVQGFLIVTAGSLFYVTCIAAFMDWLPGFGSGPYRGMFACLAPMAVFVSFFVNPYKLVRPVFIRFQANRRARRALPRR
jgi:hypothetical protein